MKLRPEFITHEDNGEQLMISVDGSFNGMVRSNSTAGEIIDLLKEETTLEKIADAMLEKYEVERDVLVADIEKVVASLRQIGAIDE